MGEAEPPRPSPDRRQLEEALKDTLAAIDATGEKPARVVASRNAVAGQGAVPGQGVVAAGTAAPPIDAAAPVTVASRRRLLALLGGLLLVGLASLLWLRPVSGPPVPPAEPRLAALDRASIAKSLETLSSLQSASLPGAIQYEPYAARVLDTKVRLDGSLFAEGEPALTQELRDAMALHLLAADAWHAKIVDQPDSWASVGNDPRVALCPTVKRGIDTGTEPAGMRREHWKGIAVAAAIPALWTCAQERLAAVERVLKER